MRRTFVKIVMRSCKDCAIYQAQIYKGNINMKKLAFTLVSLLSFTGLAYASNTTQTDASAKHEYTTTQAENQVKWHYYSDDVFAKAKKENKTVLLFAMTEGCHWCQKMKAETFSSQVVIDQMQKGFYPAILDVMTEKETAQKLRISSVPVIVYYNKDGKVIKKFRGYVGAGEMLQQLAVADLLVNQSR